MKHKTEGRKPTKAKPYIAMVEGTDGGVDFCTFYKRMDTAKQDAFKTGGVVTDLFTLKRSRFVNEEWRDA